MIRSTIMPSTNISNIYMSVLASLSIDDRLDLIAKLSSSIKNAPRSAFAVDDLRTMFCGEWGNAEELRDNTFTGREVMNW